MGKNIIIGYPNRADAAAFSAGSWESTLPVTNIASRELWKVARSADADLTSTKFRVDLVANKQLHVFSLCNHNLSASATWRVTLGTTAGGSDVYDSGWKAVWLMTFDSVVEWGSAVWWSVPGGDEYLRSPFNAVIIANDTFAARHITVEINDTANADGYVQIGRLFAGGAIQPAYNAQYGLQDSWRDLSTFDTAESGVFWATERRRMRSVSFVLPWLSPGESAYFHELQRQVGTIGEVLYIPYPSDMGESQRYGFLGRLSELSPIDYPYYRARSLPLKIEELG